MTDTAEVTTAFERRRVRIGRAGLVAGPVLAVVAYLLVPERFTDGTGTVIELGQPGRATAAVAVLMAVWWMTEAIEISATALLPLALFPLLDAMTIDEAAAPYANPLIFLFFGGFVLALSMQRWGLERRIALIALRLVGTEPRRVVGGVMVITGVFSMWVSNTATAAMMLPVALSLIDAAVPTGRGASASGGHPAGSNFARALLLGLAYAASIGGVGTLVGTPPNLFLASFARDSLDVDISFVAWLGIGVPIMAVLLPVVWYLLTYVLFPPDVGSEGLASVVSDDAHRALGPMSRGEWATFLVFTVTALAWVFRPLLDDLAIGGARPLAGLSDAGIAVMAALALFLIPVGRGQRAMDWETTKQVPWGILLLFGGGLSLAAAIESTGLAEYLGSQAEALDALPAIVIVLVVTAGVVFLSELASNTATAAALLPIFAAVAPGLGMDPLALAVPTALAASLAFMMPVGTPPNAIVFGSGQVPMPDMMRAGIRANLASIVVITATTVLLAAPILGFEAPLG